MNERDVCTMEPYKTEDVSRGRYVSQMRGPRYLHDNSRRILPKLHIATRLSRPKRRIDVLPSSCQWRYACDLSKSYRQSAVDRGHI
jgi:hypothetical protein